MRTLTILAAAMTLAATAQAQTSYRTPWGDPDIQGTWNNGTPTPLERPAMLGDKLYWTEAEAKAINQNSVASVLKAVAPAIATSGELNETWLEPGRTVRDRRTSLIIDPPNGKVPFTPEGKKRFDATPSLAKDLPADGPEDRAPSERCLGADDILLPNPFYNNNHQIVQGPGWVAFSSEVMHQVRIIPLDGRPHPHKNVTQWVGDSVGHWEGQTLVVETTNFNERRLFRGSTPGLRLVERLTRVDAETIDYQFTVTDAATFTQPWTVSNTLRATPGAIYEYACHEGNYSLAGILTGARAEEKRR